MKMKLKKYKRNIKSLRDIKYTISNLEDIKESIDEQEEKYKITAEIERQEEKLQVLEKEILKTERNIESILTEYNILKKRYENGGRTRKQLVKYLIARGINEKDILTPETKLYEKREKYNIIKEKPEEPGKEEYNIRIRIIKDTYYIILYKDWFEKNNYRILIKHSYMNIRCAKDNYEYDYVITKDNYEYDYVITEDNYKYDYVITEDNYKYDYVITEYLKYNKK